MSEPWKTRLRRLRQSDARQFTSKRPAEEQFWSCFQRLLSFEDPIDRWQKVVALAAKHADGLKEKDASQLPISAQEQLFNSVFGSEDLDDASILAATTVNIILSLEDARRFSLATFGQWEHMISQSAPAGKKSKGHSPDPEMEKRSALSAQLQPELKKLTADIDGEASRQSWVMHAGNAVPDWELLTGDGPWDEDARAKILADLFLHVKSHRGDSLQNLQKHFHKEISLRRKQLPASFMPSLLLLVEGGTEAVLLPHLARLINRDFDALAVMVTSVGGSKQMARRYLELKDSIVLPIVIVVDRDAEEQIEMLSDALRDQDRLHTWSDGEIEDTFQIDVLVRHLNFYARSCGSTMLIQSDDFRSGVRRTQMLDKLWRQSGLGDFDKIGFAQSLTTTMTEAAEIPADIRSAILMIAERVGGQV
jgi:hypothetical protein